MNVAVGTILFFWLLAGGVFCFWDVVAECRFQTAAAEHDELLDELWDDEATA